MAGSGVSERLVRQAAALVPQLRAGAATAEQLRRLPPETFDALAAADVFRMTAPRRFGGFEADFVTQCEVLAEVARGCPSASWVSTILSAMSWLVAGFPDEAQEEVFDGGDPRVSGVFSPTGTVVSKNGGYVVNGRWGYNTGGHGGKWTVVTAVLTENGAPAGPPFSCLVKSSELERLDDWQASGMAATGSSTVLAKDIFVPAHRVLPLPDLVDARYPKRHNSAEPFFNYPLAAVLTANAAGTPVGIARGALERFLERLPGRAITYTAYTSQIEAPVTHLQVGEAALAIDSADAHMRRACALLDQGDGTPSKLDRVKIRAHAGAATQYARQAVDTLFHASGASAIQASVPIQRLQRDMQALSNHAIMHPQTNVELYGRVLCGLEPNTLLY